MKTLFAALALAVGVAAPAMALDISAQQQEPPPPPIVTTPPVYNWSGFYNDATGAGTRWGDRWGAQYQWNNLVLGVESAYSDPFAQHYGTTDCAVSDSRCEASRGLGAVGARLGWSSNRLLLFGTAGFTWGHLDGPSTTAAGLQTTGAGSWYAGAGVEYALTTSSAFDVILGAEYRRIGAPTRRDFDPAGLLNITPRDFRTDVDLARAHLSIKVNSWAPWAPLTSGKK